MMLKFPWTDKLCFGFYKMLVSFGFYKHFIFLGFNFIITIGFPVMNFYRALKWLIEFGAVML